MSGKRQHYVPRLLQRGFLNDPADGAERTWLHRRGASPRLVSIRDVGVEDWFYSRKSPDGTPTLDDTITELERDLGASIRALRASPPGLSIDAGEAARTVVHLVMRTAHLRRVFSAGLTYTTKEIESLFTDPDRLGGMVGVTGPAPASFILEAIRDSVAELVPRDIPAPLAERLVTFELRELSEDVIEQTITVLGPIFPQLLDGVAGMVRDAHNSILATSLESNAWIRALAGFEWTVEAGVDLILPDAVAIGCEDDCRFTALLFTKAADVRAVAMPVSSDRILIGQVPGRDPIDIGRFNIQAAASCETFFIAAKPIQEDRLNALIGSAPANVIEEAISEAVAEAEQARSTAGIVRGPTEAPAVLQQGFSYSVRLADFGDEIRAKEFAAVMHGVVGELARRLPLHQLDGFTIAVDYPGALATLHRGDPELPPVTSGALSYGLGVAKPATVIRDNVRKEHLVVAAELAEKWLSPDDKVRATGVHMLVKILAGVAHSTLYTSSGREATFTPDAMGRELHRSVATAPAGYWSARQAAFVCPDQGQTYADLVIDCLDFAEREIAAERVRIPEIGEIGNVTRRALECVSAALIHAADWLGHRDGLVDGQAFAGSDLPERLSVRGLDRWIDLFGRDLASCYGSDGALNLEVVASLSRHVERLFWSFGIYCWPEDDEVQCLVTDRAFLPPKMR